MTLIRAARPPRGALPNVATYRRGFIEQVHQLVAAGYARLQPKTLAQKEETAITGLLITAMRDVIEGAEGLDWAWRFAVHDDPPVATPGREGKARARLDILIERTQPGHHPRFQFEAKRLYRSDSVAAYVGDEGLGAFASGSYAANDETAGMLGYIQVDEPADWIQRIAKKLESDRGSHGLSPSTPVWTQCTFGGVELLCYESKHQRASTPLLIVHTFISCC